MSKKTNEHTVDVKSLEIFTNQIGSESNYLIQEFEGPLCHYTDLDALKGIVQNHDLWLTNLRYSNDEREMAHGYDIAKEIIDEKRKLSKSKRLKTYLDKVAKLVAVPPSNGVYICCFCMKDNLLSQWRAYGENGMGVSIAFRSQDFAWYGSPDLPPDEIGLMRLWKVYYKPEVQEKIVEKALNLIPKINQRDSLESRAQKAADAIHFFIPTFKNKDFMGEKERRLIFTPSSQCSIKPCYRTTRGMLVPYYSLQALGKHIYKKERPLPIKRVTIGPSGQKDLNVESVKMLLSQNGYKKVRVGASKTPYRG